MSVSLEDCLDQQIVLRNAYDAIVGHAETPLQMKAAEFCLGELAAAENRNASSASRVHALTISFLKRAQVRTRFHVFALADLVQLDHVSKKFAQNEARQNPESLVYKGCHDLVARRRDQIVNIQVKMTNFERLRKGLSKVYPVMEDEDRELKCMRASFKVAANNSNNHIKLINLRDKTGIVDWDYMLGNKPAVAPAAELAVMQDRLLQFLPVEADAAQQEAHQALIFLDMVRCHQHWLKTVAGSAFPQEEVAQLAELAGFLENHIQIGMEVSEGLTADLEKVTSMGRVIANPTKMPSFK